MINGILVFVSFSVIIIVHELGHLISAKLVGFEVEEFAIGFGKRIFYKKYKDTIYSIRLIPLGGFNKINYLDSYKNRMNINLKDYLKRIFVLSAGSLFNFLSVFICLFIMALTFGIPAGNDNVVSYVDSNSPAYQYVQPNDKLLSINNMDYDNENLNTIQKDSFMKIIYEADFINLKIERNNEIIDISFDKPTNSSLNIYAKEKMKKLSIFDSLKAAQYEFCDFSMLIVDATKALFYSNPEKITQSISGPIGISTAMYKITETNGIFGLGILFNLITLNIAMFNLLPIPLLDGGHIVITTIIAIFKNRIKESHIKIISIIGISIILFMFLLGLYSDIIKIFF